MISVIDSTFYKLSGGGNDFVALADLDGEPRPDEIRALCRRGVSVGADGLFSLRREAQGVRMTYWNADGLPAALCLNGTRCAAWMARHLGWAAEAVTVRTGVGPIEATAISPNSVTIAVPPPSNEQRRMDVVLGSEPDARYSGWALEIGVPHFVLEWPESLATAPVESLGSKIRNAQAFEPAGTNVMFARFPKNDRLELRSFERGVEAETLSCGTGILAAAAVGVSLGKLEMPIEVTTLGGFPFAVDGEVEDSRVRTWSLTGDVRLVAVGTIQTAALTDAQPPTWST